MQKKKKKKEESNRIGKTRDLFKKIRDTQGTFHAKVGAIKDRNGKDTTEAEKIKKRWQKYTEELYKKTQITRMVWHPGVWSQVGLWKHYYEQS